MRIDLSAAAVVLAIAVAQTNSQQVANSSSGSVTQLAGVADRAARSQPAGRGDRRPTVSPGPQQTFDRDYTSPAGIGCGLLCRAGIQ